MGLFGKKSFRVGEGRPLLKPRGDEGGPKLSLETEEVVGVSNVGEALDRQEEGGRRAGNEALARAIKALAENPDALEGDTLIFGGTRAVGGVQALVRTDAGHTAQTLRRDVPWEKGFRMVKEKKDALV